MKRSAQEPVVLLTGGGTGGHLAIVRALKEAFLKRGIRPLYIGSQSGQDRRWFADDDDFSQKFFLKTRGVVNRRGIAKAAALWEIAKAAAASGRIIREANVQAVVSVGGFSAASAAFAAILTRTPLFIHEQNAVPGRLNALLRPFAAAFFSSFGFDAVPYPVADRFFEKARLRKALKTIIFLGGSQGATAINEFALKAAPMLKKRDIKIIHQTGERDVERVRRGYEKMGIEAEVFAFYPALDEKIAEADFAVSRAGASTLWELAASQIPTLFVPYPYAAGDHQYHNARYLAEQDAGYVIRQEDLRPDTLEAILNRPLAPVSRKLVEMIEPGGADRIVEAVLRDNETPAR